MLPRLHQEGTEQIGKRGFSSVCSVPSVVNRFYSGSGKGSYSLPVRCIPGTWPSSNAEVVSTAR